MPKSKPNRNSNPRTTIAEAVHHVEPIPGEPMRFFVRSRSRKTPWLVDIDEYDGTGQCRCEDFTCNQEPFLNGKKASEGHSPDRRCFHIKVAIEYRHLLDVFSRKLAT